MAIRLKKAYHIGKEHFRVRGHILLYPSLPINNNYLYCFVAGGYEVATSIKNFDFHINVCRGITSVPGGRTQGCPTNSAMCRVDKNLQTSEDIGNINFASNLYFSSANDIILVYNTTKKVQGCRENPVTTITFKCPRESVSHWTGAV